jgi:hypothetical protein
MRADFSRRIDTAAASLPTGFRPAWWPAGRLALALLLIAGAGLAVVAVRHWTAKPNPEAPPPPAHRTPATPAPEPLKPEPPKPEPLRAHLGTPATLPVPAAQESPEIAAVAALHRIGADLGEPVRISAEEPQGVTVFCGDLDSAREFEIRAALAAVPEIAFRMEPPSPARSAPGALSFAPQRNPLATRLETALGGAAAFQAAANSVVDEDEQSMAAAHALHNLDLRFPPAREAALSAPDRAVVKAIRADIEESFRSHARKLLALLAPVRRALAAQGEPAGSGIFESAKRMDRAVLILFGGAASPATPGQLAAELEGAAAQLAAAAGGLQ